MLRTLKIFPVVGDFRCNVTPRVLSLSTRARAANDSSFNGWWEQLYTGTYFKILSGKYLIQSLSHAFVIASVLVLLIGSILAFVH